MPRNSNGLSDRVREVMSGQSERNFAQMIGISLGALKGALSGSKPTVDNLLAIADGAGVRVEWLAAGSGPMREGESCGKGLTRIPRHNIQLSAGHGSFVERSEVLNYIPFNDDFFQRYLQRDPKDMIIVDARGESMEPTMRDRDLLMIDTSSASRPITSALYGFTFGQDVFVKRLFVTPDHIIAKSDNKDYGEFIIGPDNVEQFHPIGRVVWIGRTL